MDLIFPKDIESIIMKMKEEIEQQEILKEHKRKFHSTLIMIETYPYSYDKETKNSIIEYYDGYDTYTSIIYSFVDNKENNIKITKYIQKSNRDNQTITILK